jgi:putative membrane protein
MSVKSMIIAMSLALGLAVGPAQAKSVKQLNDLEIAHVAYTAGNIDIRYAHLALAKSKNPAVRNFARTMLRDHAAVNRKALALLAKLKVSARANAFSRALSAQSDKLVSTMSRLEGAAFDRAYARNELAYHKAVNKLVEHSFIPRIRNGEMKALFRQALAIFKVHQGHAARMVRSLRQ